MSKIKIQIVISLTVYVVSYFVKTFILFKFTNPFEWILIIPKLTPENRAILLTLLLMYYACCNVAISMYKEEKEYNEKYK